MDSVAIGAVGLGSRRVVAETVSGFADVVKTLVMSMSPAMLIERVGQGRTSCANGEDSLEGISATA